MSSCRKYRSYFPDALYGDLDPKMEQSFRNHLDTCKACSAQLKKLESALTHMKTPAKPDPGEAFWQNYWEKLYLRLESEDTS